MSSDQNLRDRVGREEFYHSKLDVLSESYRQKYRFKHIFNYPSHRRLNEAVEAFLQEISGKTVLDYGCGRGKSSLKYLHLGANVVGIDISLEYIKAARHLANNAGDYRKNCLFQVSDAHDLPFADETFHLIVGEGILHHLDAEVALNEIWRVLRPGGRVLLKEPLADNPLLRLFRALTPAARTQDEAPFSKRDINRILGSRDWEEEVLYCGLLEAPVAVLTSILIPDDPENVLLQIADILERWMHKWRILLSWNQYILFSLVKAS